MAANRRHLATSTSSWRSSRPSQLHRDRGLPLGVIRLSRLGSLLAQTSSAILACALMADRLSKPPILGMYQRRNFGTQFRPGATSDVVTPQVGFAIDF